LKKKGLWSDSEEDGLASQWEASREERTVKKSERKDFEQKGDTGNVFSI
jgi:hypothetical protein